MLRGQLRRTSPIQLPDDAGTKFFAEGLKKLSTIDQNADQQAEAERNAKRFVRVLPNGAIGRARAGCALFLKAGFRALHRGAESASGFARCIGCLLSSLAGGVLEILPAFQSGFHKSSFCCSLFFCGLKIGPQRIIRTKTPLLEWGVRRTTGAWFTRRQRRSRWGDGRWSQ